MFIFTADSRNMKILLSAAAAFELKPVLNKLTFVRSCNEYVHEYMMNGQRIDLLITGIGIMTTAYQLGKLLSSNKYDLAVNAGICGSYHPDALTGEVVEIVTEYVSDLGAEEAGGFSSLTDLGLQDPNLYPFRNGILTNNLITGSLVLDDLAKRKGATVSTIPGKIRTPGKNLPAWIPDIESMEGAAFFYACRMEGINFTEIRSISNFVYERDKTKWNITLAVNNLNEVVFNLLQEQTTVRHL